MSIRILCTGDVHLGRRPSRIPENIDAHALGPAAAWGLFVNSAIELKVHAACLTGDVVDASNRFYEAFSLLQSGVQKLVDAGIAVYAVSGNHDWDVLPRLADRIPEFRLLGRGGKWEQTVLPSKETPAVRLVGWSFPARHFSTNPLANLDPPKAGMATVGLLHCDCGASGGPYGPVALEDLADRNVDAWLLGHIHKPDIRSKSLPLVLYPGSPQGLNPGEPGAHGAWLVTIESGRPPKADHLPMEALRWEQIDVPLEGVGDEDALNATVIDAMRARHDEIRGEMSYTKAVGCRLRLQGRTAIHRRLASLTSGMRTDLKPPFDEVEYFIEKIEDLSRPDLDLEDIAGANDPAGLLARRLLILDRAAPEEAYLELIRAAGEAIHKRRSASAFVSLPDSTDPPGEEEVRDMLVSAGMRMLDNLLAQKESGE